MVHLIECFYSFSVYFWVWYKAIWMQTNYFNFVNETMHILHTFWPNLCLRHPCVLLHISVNSVVIIFFHFQRNAVGRWKILDGCRQIWCTLEGNKLDMQLLQTCSFQVFGFIDFRYLPKEMLHPLQMQSNLHLIIQIWQHVQPIQLFWPDPHKSVNKLPKKQKNIQLFVSLIFCKGFQIMGSIGN